MLPAMTMCSSEHSLEDESRDPMLPGNSIREGDVAPSRTCDSRKLSAVVVTTASVDHKLAQGRPRIVMSSSSSLSGQSDGTYASSATNDIPEPLRPDAWTEGDATQFEVRAGTYLVDKRKMTSLPSIFKLMTVDLVQVEHPLISGLCSHPDERIQLALRREETTGVRELPNFIFAVNLAIPGKSSYHLVMYFGVDNVSELRATRTPWGRLTEKFFFGDSDEFRNHTFKLIPRIVEGNYMVRKAVGSKPAILGTRLKQHYIRTGRYFEVVVDISSSTVAQRVVKLAQGYAKGLVVDMMFLLEGVDEDTLPERILGGVRISNIDFKHKDGQRSCTTRP